MKKCIVGNRDTGLTMEEVEISTISKAKPSSQPAVSVRDAYKRYSKNDIIFNGLNLSVADGIIYGLLGPSGCGKTTLLNCINGRTTLDSGIIEVNARKRSDIGYMPQDMCLYLQLTILENFRVYGYLFGISEKDILARAKNLVSFLELPSENTFIDNLSGGQQRRVSLAVTFIHDPRILILDEPTVGLDPVLSHSIWQRFIHMAARGKTIIITTHYIEEAKQANMIGVMRNGKLLAEAPPMKLIEKYECNELEDVFLLLSRKQEIQSGNEEINYPETKNPVRIKYEEDAKFASLTRIKAVTYKNFAILRREYLFLILVLLLPISQTYFGNLTLGVKPKNLHLAVINEETPLSNCSPSSYERGCFLNEGNDDTFLSCMYLDYLRKETYILDEYNDYEIASHSVRKKQARALLRFPKNYTKSLALRVDQGLHTSNQTVISGSMDFWVDSSDQYIATCIKYDVFRFVSIFLQHALTNCGLHPEAALSIPLTFEEPIFGKADESFTSQVSAAMLSICCFFLPAMLTGGFIFLEKMGGLIDRLLVAGVTPLEIVTAVSILQIFIQIIQTTEAMFITYVWFSNPLNGSVFLMSLLMTSVGLSGMFFGLMLAVGNSDLGTTVYAGIGANIAMAFTTGMSWPLEGAHYVLKAFVYYIPLTLPIEAARAIGSKSYKLSNSIVWEGFASSIIWGLIFLGSSFLFMKYKKNVWMAKKF